MPQFSKIFGATAFWVATVIGLAQPALADRLKDLTSVAGVRANQLVGYGIVVGLRDRRREHTAYASDNPIHGGSVWSVDRFGGHQGQKCCCGYGYR